MEKIEKVEKFRNRSLGFLSKVNREINEVFSKMLGFSISLLAILCVSILYFRHWDSVPVLAVLMVGVFVVVHYVKKFVTNVLKFLILKVKNYFSRSKGKCEK